MNGPVISICIGGYRSAKEFSLWVVSAVETLIIYNRLFLARHPTPDLYSSGVVYKSEPREWESEHFDAVPIVNARKWGDCDDLVAWRIAQLRNQLDPKLEHLYTGCNDVSFPKSFPKVRIAWKQHLPSNKWLYHVQLRHANGEIEDPSAKLGMRVV